MDVASWAAMLLIYDVLKQFVMRAASLRPSVECSRDTGCASFLLALDSRRGASYVGFWDPTFY